MGVGEGRTVGDGVGVGEPVGRGVGDPLATGDVVGVGDPPDWMARADGTTELPPPHPAIHTAAAATTIAEFRNID